MNEIAVNFGLGGRLAVNFGQRSAFRFDRLGVAERKLRGKRHAHVRRGARGSDARCLLDAA